MLSARVALAVAAVVLVAGVSCADQEPIGGGVASPGSTSTTASATTVVTPSTTTAPAPPPPERPTTTAPAPPSANDGPVLAAGDRGSSVADIQRRLRELRFWGGDDDGDFGFLTEQAVFAFQKANGLTVDGRVGARTRAKLDAPDPMVPQSRDGRVMEVDKARQLLVAVLDGKVQWIFNTSTGTERPYRHPSGSTAMADTPAGRHPVIWQYDGWRDGRLGRMYRPKYFHRDGIAVHGYGTVPPYPASHGCVRVSIAAMDFIWLGGLMPLDATVLVYGTTPER
jgi:hypothetical protein